MENPDGLSGAIRVANHTLTATEIADVVGMELTEVQEALRKDAV